MVTVQNVDIEKAMAWIDEHWKGKKACPICENTKWLVGDAAGEVRAMPENARLVSGSKYPLVLVTCQVCGYTLLFNAIVIGLVESEV